MLHKRKYFCWFIIGVFLCAVISGGCGADNPEVSPFSETEYDNNVNQNNGDSTNQNTNQNNSNSNNTTPNSNNSNGTQNNNGNSNNTNQNNNGNNGNNNFGNTISYTALAGTWAGLNGSGSFNHQDETDALIVEEVEYGISNIQYSESTGTGTANLMVYERATDNPLISHESDGSGTTYSMKNVGENSWNFTNDQGTITLTLTSETEGTVKESGIAKNNNPDFTYSLSCNVKKFNDVDYGNYDLTLLSGTWKPSSGYIDVKDGGPWIGGKLLPDESTNAVINVTPTATGYNIQISAYKFVYNDIECEEEELNTELSPYGTFGYEEEDGTTVTFEIYTIDDTMNPQGTIISIKRDSYNTDTVREEKGRTYLHRVN